MTSTLIAAICFGVAAIAQVGSVILIVISVQSAKRRLDAPTSLVIDGGVVGTINDQPLRDRDDTSERFLLQSLEKQKLAVCLLILGIGAGTAGNYLALSWGAS
jgi:hypothetical protein